MVRARGAAQHNDFGVCLKNLANDVQEVQCWKTVRQEQSEKICSLSVKDAESVYEESRDRTAKRDNQMDKDRATRTTQWSARKEHVSPIQEGSRCVAHVVSQALQLTS